MAEEMDRRGAVAATGGVLEANAEWSAGVAGSADGSGASGTAGLCGSVCGIGTGREADCGAERAESTAWGDAVHDVAGGMGGAVGQTVGAAGRGDRDTGSGARADRDGESDRAESTAWGDAVH